MGKRRQTADGLQETFEDFSIRVIFQIQCRTCYEPEALLASEDSR